MVRVDGTIEETSFYVACREACRRCPQGFDESFNGEVIKALFAKKIEMSANRIHFKD
ncbi:hypothetical protein K9K77_03035 [Candidatus Babeliales bacterium]|nr:hypothetical protein [Candidatus Babeliales bacterium]